MSRNIISAGSYIVRALGQGNTRLSIITSAALALVSFFYIYTLGSYFKISIYILQNRVIYDTFFNFYIINKYADHLIIVSGTVLWLALSIRGKARFITPAIYSGIVALAATTQLYALLDISVLMSAPIITSFLLYNKFAIKNILNINKNLSINYLAIIGIAIAILSIVISLVPPFFSIQLESIPIRNYAYDIFLFFSSFSPVVIFLLVNCFPVKLLLKEFKTGILKIKDNGIDLLFFNNSIKSRTKIIYLSFFMLLSVTMVLIPHQPTINKDNQQIGADTGDYINWIKKLLQSSDLGEFIRQAFVTIAEGDRPLTLILLFIITTIVGSDLFYTIDNIVPMILGPILVLVVYLLTRELTSNDITSLLASFLTTVSFHTLIGIYAGFYANWFAIIIGYLSFLFLVRFLKTSSIINLTIYSALVVLLLFSHVYTWSVLAVVTGIFLAVLISLNYYPKRRMIFLLLVVLSSVVIDVSRMTITGSGGGIERDIEIANEGLNLEQFALRWSNIIDTTQIYFGSQFSNFIILGLGLYWLFHFSLREPYNILMVIFLSVAIISLFFGDWLVQSRILYNIPFQIPAAIALTYIKKRANGGNIILLSICILLIAMSIRAVSNYYLIMPS